jgi:sporulation protein YlmC with PRC-barrel domain
MSHYATLNEYHFQSEGDDIRGAKLYGEGGQELGRIRDVVFDHATGNIEYLVLEYGSDRRVLLPTDRVFRTVMDEDSFSSELTLDDLDHLPAFEEKLLKNEQQWRDYEKLHRSTIEDRKPVASTEDRSNVTSIDSTRGDDYVPDVWPQRIAPVFGSTRNDSEKLEMASKTREWHKEDNANRLGLKWNRFAERVKHDLQSIRGRCERCAEKDTRAA